MRVLFNEGVVREVISAEVKPMDVGDGQIIGTEIIFIVMGGDKLEYIYSQNVPIEESGQRAIDFVKKLYLNGIGDFTHEPVEML
ncbi:MAG: hypothetical protein K6E91_11905 [Butyrivibrio sp.]|nr:hypothetical protein [Butyrivibrio sp.]